MAAAWWWEYEAAFLAAAGDYKAAYEARLQVPYETISVMAVRPDEYVEELESKLTAAECEIESLKNKLTMLLAR